MYFQAIRNLGHFRPPWHTKCASLGCQGQPCWGFFKLKVGVNGGKGAN